MGEERPAPAPGIVTPYYQDGAVTIYHGDCREILPGLDPVDLVLTDPPYGVNKAEWDHSFPTEWMQAAARLAPAMGLMPGIWNITRCPHRIGELVYVWTLAAHLINGMARGAIGFGNWIPCLVYTREGHSMFVKDGDCRSIVIGDSVKPDHPSPKPYRVMLWFVRRLPGNVILDPFMGSGTTLRAAKDHGKKAIGIEIEEAYCELAALRMAQEVLPLEMPGELDVPVEQEFALV